MSKKPASSSSASTLRAPAAEVAKMVFTREDALRTGRIPFIAGHERTPAGVDAELAAIPGDYLRTAIPVEILDREAEEMIRLMDDVATFTARGMEVTKGHFELISILRTKLPKQRAERDVATTAYTGYDDLEDSQAAALRTVIGKLRLLTMASGLSEELCSLNGAKGNLRMMDAGRAIIAKCTPHLAMFRPANEAKAMLDLIGQYVDSIEKLRSQQAGEAGVMTTDAVHRAKRLIFDAMRYVGARGEYVFAEDPTRLPGYQLQHVNNWSNGSKKRKKKVSSDGDVATFSGTGADDGT